MEINYIGEQLWAGKLGHMFIVLSFVGALVSAVSYAMGATDNDRFAQWKALARGGFMTHALGVLGIIGTLFYLLINHRFEYHYVWQHSNTEMPLRYILSCFWEGQEGSFLLWTFWHMVLGFFLMRLRDGWEAPVMAVVGLVQAFLASMLLGTVILGYRLGSNPFVLLREHPEFANLPFIQVADYLKSLDGRGLNPLLQNYWMTIHPPVLFLGFASTLVPFAFALAGLWQRRFSDWVKPALPWALFGMAVLGTGILMGGAWAYEALSFGGFWAWDPVENSSLVPWIVLVAATHVLVIHKSRGQSLLLAYSLSVLSFLLVLYSTFLTRSGILGDTSVHAFTDLGMSGQLLLYLLTFVALGIILPIVRWKELPSNKDDDSLPSREFWMFVGSLVLCVSAFQITTTTSIPVINKVLGTDKAPPLDAIRHYNSWQLPLAIIIGLLIGLTQYLRYKSTPMDKFWKGLLWPALLSVLGTIGIAVALQYTNVLFVLMLFATQFAIYGNVAYWLTQQRGNLLAAGSSVAHIGFGLILLGAFISTSRTQVISMNTSGVDVQGLGEDFKNSENILMFKGDTLRMGLYHVVYKGRRKEGINIYYEVEYLIREGNAYTSAFTLNPRVQTNPRMGNVAEPDTRHFLSNDIYSFITYAELEDPKPEEVAKDMKLTQTKALSPGDTLMASNAIMVFEGFDRNVDLAANNLQPNDLAVAAVVRATDVNGTVRKLRPLYVVRGLMAAPVDADDADLGLRLRIKRIEPENGSVEMELYENPSKKREFIVLKAMVFPYINILWAGCIIMAIGTLMAMLRRWRMKG